MDGQPIPAHLKKKTLPLLPVSSVAPSLIFIELRKVILVNNIKMSKLVYRSSKDPSIAGCFRMIKNCKIFQKYCPILDSPNHSKNISALDKTLNDSVRHIA